MLVGLVEREPIGFPLLGLFVFRRRRFKTSHIIVAKWVFENE